MKARVVLGILAALTALGCLAQAHDTNRSSQPDRDLVRRWWPSGQESEFRCWLDWNRDGDVNSEDVALCLLAARDAVTDNDDGQDNTVRVLLPDGEFDICSTGVFTCPFELRSGMHLIGAMPRLKLNPAEGGEIADVGPDLDMQPNGGTWLTTGDSCEPSCTTDIFTGRALRGIVLERIGFRDYRVAIALGAPGVGGAAFSRFQDLYFVGAQAKNSSDAALRIYNFQHLRGDHIKVYDSRTGLHLINHNGEWQGGNSVFSDFYVHTYPNPVGGIILESAGGPLNTHMNYVTLIRPQVNSFSGSKGRGTTSIHLKGTPSNILQGISLIDANIEGQTEYGIKLEHAKNCAVYLAGVSTFDAMQAGVFVDRHSTNNVLISTTASATLELDSTALNTQNQFLGNWRMADGTRMADHPGIKGSFRDVPFNRSIGKYDHVEIAGHSKLASDQALRVARQTTPDWNKGNVHLEGGGLTTGHLCIGRTHLWEETDGRLRIRADTEGAPEGQGDGNAVLTGTGSPFHGTVLWGNASQAAWDTGNEVCAGSGLTCLIAIDPRSGDEIECGTAIDTTPGSGQSTLTGYFQALCY